MRIAILDLGTNTFHLLIASVNKRGDWKKVFKSKTAFKLGEGAIHQNEVKSYDGRIMNISLEHYLNELNDCNDAHYLHDKLMF